MSTRYTTIRPIASGGMGTVYLGRREGLGGFSRLVALKRAHPDLASKPSVQRRFVREANAASMLHHANVVAVVDLFTEDGESWLVLDWVDGTSLSQLVMDRGQLPIEVAIHIVLDACAGLAAAHELRVDDAPLGLQHRDISPGNILVGRDGVARIADFGLSRTLDTTLTNTEERFLEGKLGYLAPELFQGKDFDERSDLYALGVVAWEVIAGMRLFRAKTVTKLMAEQKAPTRLSVLYPSLAWLEPVIDRAMAFEPAARAPSVRAFMNELTQAAREHRALGTADEVSRFMLAADATAAPIAELSGKTPLTGALLDATPVTGPLLSSISALAPEVSSSDILVDAVSSPAVTAAMEPDDPTPPPPARASVAPRAPTLEPPTQLPPEAPEPLAARVSLAPGSFLVAQPAPLIDDPVSLDSTLIPASRPRAGLWLAGLAAAAVLSGAAIVMTRDGATSSSSSARVEGTTPPTPSPAFVPTTREPTTPATTSTAIVIGHEEAASARVRAGQPSAHASVEVKTPTAPPPIVTAPPPTSTSTSNGLPDNPYRKKP